MAMSRMIDLNNKRTQVQADDDRQTAVSNTAKMGNTHDSEQITKDWVEDVKAGFKPENKSKP